MFAMVHSKPHSERKRMISNVYSKSTLQGSSQLAENSKLLLTTRLLPYVERVAKAKSPVDVFAMNLGFTMDFMTAYQFGLASATKWSVDHETRDRFLHMWGIRKPFEFYRAEIPKLSNFLQSTGIQVFPKYLAEANAAFEELNLQMCDAADKYLGQTDNVGDEPVVYKQLKNAVKKSIEKGERDPEVGKHCTTAADTRLEIASEMLDQLGAGFETTGIALTYLYWELSRNPEWQTKLRQELESLSPRIWWPAKPTADFPLPSPKSIDELPILHAVIMETLRLHSPIPGNEPRITPQNPCTLAGYANIPANVRVQAQPYSLHRNAEVFPDPESWSPGRWIQPSESKSLKEMLRWFWAFGSGGRMCIGSNLAVQEMKLVVAAIYTNFTTGIVDDDGIEAIDAYTTRPAKERLILQFASV